MSGERALLEETEHRLRRLSHDRLRVANDFLAYLEEREETEATQELLGLPGFDEALQSAIKQAKDGKTVRFDDIKRDV